MTLSKIFCDRWTFQTRCCYKYRGYCENCPCDSVCAKYDGEFENEYGIRAIKYAMLLTYRKLGKKGL